ncbi:MAG: 50S ribosomal protein L10 [Actinomycetia bacterium]|nr:50S ribosomal protein L10 [Actinomycetes bacterium]
MPAKAKKEAVAEIKSQFSDSENILLVDYRGLSVKDISALRRKVADTGGRFIVYKNTLVEIAMTELALPELGSLLEGPSAFVFTGEDPVAAAKALKDFSKDHSNLELKGGLVQNQVLDSDALKALAALPTREELLAKLLGTLQNPTRGFVYVISGPARGLVTVLDAAAKKAA